MFIDSYSQQPYNKPDQYQQEVFQREVGKLWDYAKSNDEFEFRTIQDVLDENQELKKEIKWLNDVITNNISDLIEECNLIFKSLDQI